MRRTRAVLFVFAAAIGSTCVLPGQARAQRRDTSWQYAPVADTTLSVDIFESKGGESFTAPFRIVTAKPRQSVVTVRCEGKQVALGTIITADGFILTKASELSGTPLVRLPDGREFTGVLMAAHEPHDLALLKIEMGGLTPLQWRNSKDAPVGSWAVSVGQGSEPVAVGVVSVAAREVPGARSAPKFDPPVGGAYLGVALEPAEKLATIAQVFPDGGAAKAGVQVGDTIVQVADKQITDSEGLVRALSTYKPGDVIALKLRRGVERLELQATLGKRPEDRGAFQNSLGSELSRRKSGFPSILQHDGVLKPADCGGPLVDLEGKAIGLNISRAGRTETYAIPSEVVIPLLHEMRAGKHPPANMKAASR